MTTQKSLIIGMGKTGHSFAEYLISKDMKFDFADTREMPADLNKFKQLYHDRGAQFYCGELNEKLLKNYQQILLSPGFDSRHKFVSQAKNNNVAVNSDIDLFVSEVDAKIIGITGSNGKTTLTALMGHALQALKFKAAIGGNIGKAVLTLLNEAAKDIYVLELSSFQLDISHALPLDVAVVLNISADHLDRYDSYDDYIKSKASIYDNAKMKVVNLDDSACKNIVNTASKDVTTISLSDVNADVYYSEKDKLFYLNRKAIIHSDKFHLQGKHNYQNILAALAIANAMCIDVYAFAKAMSSFKGVPHRCELVKTVNGVSWINDSKATNIGAALAAINSTQKPLHIIMGGQSKGVDFTEFSDSIPSHVKNIILLGEDALFIKSFVENKANTHVVNNMREAVGFANKVSKPGDVVLLSPACASFDMYSGYEQRGNDFKSIVMEAVS